LDRYRYRDRDYRNRDGNDSHATRNGHALRFLQLRQRHGVRGGRLRRFRNSLSDRLCYWYCAILSLSRRLCLCRRLGLGRGRHRDLLSALRNRPWLRPVFAGAPPASAVQNAAGSSAIGAVGAVGAVRAVTSIDVSFICRSKSAKLKPPVPVFAAGPPEFRPPGFGAVPPRFDPTPRRFFKSAPASIEARSGPGAATALLCCLIPGTDPTIAPGNGLPRVRPDRGRPPKKVLATDPRPRPAPATNP